MTSFGAGDVLIVVSVHGGRVRSGTVWSCNLLKACEYAKAKEGVVLALLGGDGGMIGKIADVSVIVPHAETWAVEGIHCVLAHLVCEGARQF
jgi:phosphoheptose isomerase